MGIDGLQDNMMPKFSLFSFLINLLSLNLVYISAHYTNDENMSIKIDKIQLKQISYPDDVSKALWVGKHIILTN